MTHIQRHATATFRILSALAAVSLPLAVSSTAATPEGDVDVAVTQPRLEPGRSVVMPVCSYRCARYRDYTVTAIEDVYAH